MRIFDQAYIDGAFRPVLGREELTLVDPTSEVETGRLRLADAQDAQLAVDAASRALPVWAASSKAERIDLLNTLAEAVEARADVLTQATIEEYGGPVEQARWRAGLAAANFRIAAGLLADFPFTRWINQTEVVAQPVGVALHIVPWNSVYNAISVKLAGALAAGCPVVVKPSEFSPWQVSLLSECFHAAGAPSGLINVVTGLGPVVGEALTADPRIRKISFTGSTPVGKSILRASADRIQRVTLELGGKAPTIVLDDADPAQAARQALAIGFANNGQACIAGTAFWCSAPRSRPSAAPSSRPRRPSCRAIRATRAPRWGRWSTCGNMSASAPISAKVWRKARARSSAARAARKGSNAAISSAPPSLPMSPMIWPSRARKSSARCSA
jgi:aldehyde dehydrogenase (NAD+)